MIIDVIIPAYNEEKSIGKVVKDIDRSLVRNIFVVNNNSTDQTFRKATEAGAIVINESFQGYGSACLRGIREVNEQDKPADIVVFLDADYSDHPEEIKLVIEPILDNRADLVIGSRAKGIREKKSMTVPQVFGNWLATRMIRGIYGHGFTDLGPFRAIRLDSLNQLRMRDRTYGWTVEMQVRAVKQKLRCAEVAVNYRKRIGTSKVSGTVKGTILAGYKIITTILYHSIKS